MSSFLLIIYNKTFAKKVYFNSIQVFYCVFIYLRMKLSAQYFCALVYICASLSPGNTRKAPISADHKASTTLIVILDAGPLWNVKKIENEVA